MERERWLRRLFSIVAMFLLVLSISFGTKTVLAAQGDVEATSIPDHATCFFVHDVGGDTTKINENYVAYSQGFCMGVGDVLAYRSNELLDDNGVKIDVTDYVNMGKSGDVFGASLRLYVMDWSTSENKENRATLFFEVVGEDGTVKSQAVLGEYGVNNDGSNLTDDTYTLGKDWLKDLVKGEAQVQFGDTDKVYLCINQKNQVQRYDEICLWGYLNSFQNATGAVITTPSLNDAANQATFDVTNLTGEVKQVIAEVKHYDENGKITGIDEYQIQLEKGHEKQTITIDAVKGDIVSLKDAGGNYYVEPFAIGTLDWVGTWASAQLTVGDDTYPPDPGLANNTYRQVVRISDGGRQLRFTFSNEFGEAPVTFHSVHVAQQIKTGEPSIDSTTDAIITFNGGSESVTIPAGETITSDTLDYPVEDLEELCISIYFGDVPRIITSHTASRCNNWLIPGNHAGDPYMGISTTATSWYFLSSIDIMQEPECKAIVCFGDSITDGYGVVVDGYGRWSDVLAKRLQENESTTNLSVLNEGIGGNSIFGGLGPAAKNRYVRDVINQAGVGYVIILIGINDIGYASSDISDAMIAEYETMISLAHEKGIKVIAGTILPFKGNSYYSVNEGELRDSIRIKLNDWMKSEASGFDGVIDFATEFGMKTDSSIMASEYKNDGLHPNTLGYRHMGEYIDLSIFE